MGDSGGQSKVTTAIWLATVRISLLRWIRLFGGMLTQNTEILTVPQWYVDSRLLDKYR